MVRRGPGVDGWPNAQSTHGRVATPLPIFDLATVIVSALGGKTQWKYTWTSEWIFEY